MTRDLHLRHALALSWLSVTFGIASGAVSVVTGLLAHSLGVLAAGLAVLADVSGSVVLIWRFRVERHEPDRAARVEARAAAVVAAALGVVSLALVVESVSALIQGSHPGSSLVTVITAAVSILVLVPLAWRKRVTAFRLGSDALKGDSTLSAIGASTAVLALVGLLLFRAFGWWWADRVVALVVAMVAAGEAYRTVRALREP
ncbi:MAG: cation transporter [Solirubrobacterales bacterium]|nr:cation transporter [Solirubrobacterales bacterium]